MYSISCTGGELNMSSERRKWRRRRARRRWRRRWLAGMMAVVRGHAHDGEVAFVITHLSSKIRGPLGRWPFVALSGLNSYHLLACVETLHISGNHFICFLGVLPGYARISPHRPDVNKKGPQRSSRIPPEHPEAPKKIPRGFPRAPRTPQKPPKGAQETPKRTPREPQKGPGGGPLRRWRGVWGRDSGLFFSLMKIKMILYFTIQNGFQSAQTR